jgi:glycerol-3-phosphate acyltransferase PlsY
MPNPVTLTDVWPLYLAMFAGAYLLGSIPFGLVLTRLAGLGDVRKIGSGNIGATNVLRTGRKDLAAATLLLDALKGAAAVIIGWQVGGSDFAAVAALGAFLGHLFPVWLGFKGGKGVATYIGTLTACVPLAGLVFAGVWLLTAFLFRFSSLAALLGALVVPVFLYATENYQFAEVFVVLSLLLWVKHHANIRRLLAGTESRIGKKA